MRRAAVLIGVDKTGNLPRLNAAASAAREMEAWMLSQGAERDDVRLITDEAQPVTVRAIKTAVRELVQDGGVEQIIIYFSGHGVNLRYSEYWLLSEAPDDPNEAVNVDGSVKLAWQCGIPHVILISDACRTAPEGIQAQGVTGSEIFPNEVMPGPQQCIDLFFACGLGKPALEVKSATDSARGFHAVYTTTLLEVLYGREPALLEPVAEAAHPVRVVRPRPLKRYLFSELTRRLKQAGVDPKHTQVPEARITSEENAWLARIAIPVDGAAPSSRRRRGPAADEPDESLEAVSQMMVSDALAGKTRGARPGRTRRAPATRVRARGRQRGIAMAEASDVLETGREHRLVPFGPDHFEIGCGFKVRGATVVRASARTAGGTVTTEIATERDIIRVQIDDAPAANVLMRFSDGTGALLPAIKGYVSALTLNAGELTDVAYEPTPASAAWPDFAPKADELRELRAVIAAAAEHGVFRLARQDARELAERMRYVKGLDPAMAIYAAYAFSELRERKLLTEMAGFLRGCIGVQLFDVAMLAGVLDAQAASASSGTFPFFPMLSQGWALLGAERIELPAPMRGIERHLRPSLWTLFDEDGIAAVSRALNP